MTRVVLHIGPHKTGTTYLQQRFVALRDALRDAGFDYPERWQDHLHGHHSLARDLADPAREVAGPLAALLDAAARAERGLLLSSENFEDLPPAGLARLAAALAGHRTEIVYFARRWSGLLPSAWQEAVKQGSALPYADFLMTHLTRPEESDLLDYGRVLRRYAEAFGTGAIRLVSYDQSLVGGRDLLDVMLREILGVVIEAPADARRVNRTLPAFDIEIIRVLNGMAARSGGALPGGVWPMKLLYQLGAERLPAIATLRRVLGGWQRPHAVPDDLPGFRAIEARLLAQFGPAIGAAAADRLFGAEAPAETSLVAGNYWHDPAVPRAFAELAEAMQRRHRHPPEAA